jgi:hypothetical protein
MERQDGSAVVEALVEGLVHNSFARHLVLAKIHLEAAGREVSVRKDWTAGDAAQAGDKARWSPWVIEPLAGE